MANLLNLMKAMSFCYAVSGFFSPTSLFSRRAGWLALVVVFCGALPLGAAQPKAAQTVASLEITLEPTRPQPTAGSGGLIIGTIKNTSQVPVVICEQTTTLTVPSEITQEAHVSHEYAVFTVEGREVYENDDALVLNPGQSTHAFWSVNRSFARTEETTWTPKNWIQQLWKQLDIEMGYMFFQPATYKFSVQVKFWPVIEGKVITKEELKLSNYDAPGYQNAVATTTTPISAPVTVILFGAAIGGLGAFTLGKLSGRADAVQARYKSAAMSLLATVATNVSGAIGAMLLGCIVTILLSRLAETEFPIRVNVSDLWGAIAIGFVGAYSGTSVLAKILDRTDSNKKVADPKQHEDGSDSS
jgi:hypothetical protein